MSIYTTLVELSYLKRIGPSKTITVLAVIYLGFILRHSLLGLILYFSTIIGLFILSTYLLVRDKKMNENLSWDDEPRIKAKMNSYNKKDSDEYQ